MNFEYPQKTQDLIKNAKVKLSQKGCDWIVANDVSANTGTFAVVSQRTLDYTKHSGTSILRVTYHDFFIFARFLVDHHFEYSVYVERPC